MNTPRQCDTIPPRFRIYAVDDDVLDVIGGDAHTAGHAVWWNDHISDIDAEAEIGVAADGALGRHTGAGPPPPGWLSRGIALTQAPPRCSTSRQLGCGSVWMRRIAGND